MSNSLESSSVIHMYPWAAWATFGLAAVAVSIFLWYLVKRPLLHGTTRAFLLLGFGLLPMGVAVTVNIASMEQMKQRIFCGSCHVMEPFTDDAGDGESETLASRHSRNTVFGETSCYECHRDYGMYGAVKTKIGGLRHVWYYYTEFHRYSIEEARPRIRIAHPFRNANCVGCHSTNVPMWLKREDHAASLEDVRNETVSCASPACHGPAHTGLEEDEEASAEAAAPEEVHP